MSAQVRPVCPVVGGDRRHPSWEEDLAERMAPPLLTQLLRDAVPVLEWVGWRLTEVDEGRAVSLLPLVEASTNQHGTHQAALMALAADYTGGAALLSLVRGAPALGIHPQLDDEGCALWLVSLEMSYHLPSAAPLMASAEIDSEQWASIREQYRAGRAVMFDVAVHFTGDGEKIATGRCRYFLKCASKLAPPELTSKPNPIFALRSKASARLIAGLRARESDDAAPRVVDPWAAALAGPHGAFLARRFSSIIPPLRDMVISRTLDVDRLVTERVAAGVLQIVLVGVGFDMRPFRLPLGADVSTFELDLPHMLAERSRLLDSLSLPARQRTQVQYDLHHTTIASALAATTFRPALPAVFVVEGVSMYQSLPIMERLFRDITPLLTHPLSVVWMDVVKETAIRGSGVQAVDDFMTAMRRLGEPFTFGVDDPGPLLESAGLQASRVCSGRASTSGDPIFDYYDFLHIRRS